MGGGGLIRMKVGGPAVGGGGVLTRMKVGRLAARGGGGGLTRMMQWRGGEVSMLE